MASSASRVIETHGLSKAYNGTPALKPLNLEVHANSICGFLGPNGAGKTTTIKLLLGLIQPSGGSATVFGMDCVKQSEDIRARIGYLPQEPRFYDYLTARETLRFTAKFFFQGPSKAIEERVDEILDLVDLTGKADCPIRTFSGGERQRLGIAQAQVNYPDLLILDEPAASLDPLGRRDVLEVLSRLRKHTTVFYSTHILDDVQRVSDTVAILNHGKLLAYGPIEELLVSGEGPVFEVTMKGNTDRVHERVSALPWVTGIQAQPRPDSTVWLVSVSDPEAAEVQLLRLILADESIVVTEFNRKEHQLEDVFIRIVEGGQDDHRQ